MCKLFKFAAATTANGNCSSDSNNYSNNNCVRSVCNKCKCTFTTTITIALSHTHTHTLAHTGTCLTACGFCNTQAHTCAHACLVSVCLCVCGKKLHVKFYRRLFLIVVAVAAVRIIILLDIVVAGTVAVVAI